MTPNVHRHPEWKRLYDALCPTLSSDQLWSYEDLSSAAGIDIRSLRGRQQFLRCRDEVLKNHGWWFENVRGKGYRVVKPDEQPQSSMRLVQAGKRRIRKAGKVNGYAKIELMSAEVARASADMQVRFAALTKQIGGIVRESRRQLAEAEPKRLPHPLLDQQAS